MRCQYIHILIFRNHQTPIKPPSNPRTSIKPPATFKMLILEGFEFLGLLLLSNELKPDSTKVNPNQNPNPNPNPNSNLE